MGAACQLPAERGRERRGKCQLLAEGEKTKIRAAGLLPDILIACQLLLHVGPLLVQCYTGLVQAVQHLHQGIAPSNSMLLQPPPGCLQLCLCL